MNFFTRLKYLLGGLLVVGAVAVLAANLNTRISTVHEVSATVESESYTVGTPYSGVVVKRNVDVGDHVKAGEELFVVQSNQLARDLSDRAIRPSTSPYDLRDQSKLVVRATSAGKVASVAPIEGAFVTANTTLARIEEAGTSYVQADFRLTPKEYALMRDAETLTVTLPNQREVEARITRVQVQTDGQQAQTRVRARTPELDNRGLFVTGTPVGAEVRLREDGLVESVKAAASGLLTPGGET
ncbi:HlyD family efflux transporter periplasmic adaptor subunit [Nocardioides mesophilus]|uniref:HlyD family efflux transporter periplasmic adaptor subunit n=1 Tax=Nocardioides mesophilus TaxID=433659 RepID=A0A7G9R6T4_9ACTN|nr:HlyD family efflux transporter periplasmic adaptor subunit [Nocardioides mesophilus]QNN51309.1 HlyD family efflux transporter periplasmic adaptor subunit [Nocardioides mesophilus]